MIVEEFIDELNKELKSNNLISLNKETKADIKQFIPSGSSNFNILLSGNPAGGFPVGRIIELYGRESVGKTTVALSAAKHVQDKLDGIVIYIDTESACDKNRLNQLNVDLNKFIYVDTETIEKSFEVLTGILTKLNEKYPSTPVLIIWDSIAGTSAEEELREGFDKMHIGLHARIYSQSFRKVNGLFAKTNACLLCINQLRQSIGGYIQTEETFGGKALKYWSTIRIELKKGQPIQEGEKVLGYTLVAKTIKNKIFNPLLTTEMALFYDRGISEEYSIFLLFCNKNIITQAGGWYKIKIGESKDEELSFRANQWISLFNSNEKLQRFCYSKLNSYSIISNQFDKQPNCG